MDPNLINGAYEDIHEILKNELNTELNETDANTILNGSTSLFNELLEDNVDTNDKTDDIDDIIEEMDGEYSILGDETDDIENIDKELLEQKFNDTISEEIDGGIKEIKKIEINKPIDNPFIKFKKEELNDKPNSTSLDDMVSITDAEVSKNGFSGDHIRSMNSFMKKGITDIITKQFKAELNNYKYMRDKTEDDKQISHCGFSVEFTDVNLRPPITTKYKSAQIELLMPNMARLQDLTYSSSLEVSAKITIYAIKLNGEKVIRTDEIKDFRISSIPVMVKSEACNTYGLPRESVKQLHEDPNDTGGYFIVNGAEWVVDNLENIANNKFHVYKKAYMDEIARGNIISKPGDSYENSRQTIIRYFINGAITVDMTTGKLSGIQIPFYIMFRLLGLNSDKEIINNIVYGTDNNDIISKEMYKILERAFLVDDPRFTDLKAEINVVKITERLAHRVLDGIINANYKTNENSLRYFNNRMLSMIDESLFPHCGISPASRVKKIKYLGHLINNLLKVAMGIVDSTDRDSYANKRLSAAGVSLSKAFKTHFNIVVIQELKNAYLNALSSTQFKLINLADVFKSAIKTQELERLLIQSITTGNKTITVKRNEIMNRVSSQLYEHKNDLNKKSQLNSIVTPSSSTNKQNERADVMRRVHPTYLGYICTSQSADSGPKVGVNKQKAISASVCDASDSFILKKELLNEPMVIPIDNITPEQIYKYGLAKIFVNGDWIGCVAQAHELARLYRMKRRFGDNVHHLTSIVWELLSREIYFWTDVGRMARPLIIVYNNLEEYDDWLRSDRKGKPIKFRQWIKLTKQHILLLQQGKITIDDLREQRIIEYITADELLNCFISRDIELFNENITAVTKIFTHCDIPINIFGLAALTSPFTNHSSGVRVTYHTNQKKQTAGWFSLNWAYMMHKGVFLQYYCDYPLVRTYPDKLTNPNGQNVMIALMCYSGFNQEDSAIINKTSVERGLYQGSKFDLERTELEQGEQFGNPDFTKTLDIKKNAVYEYIEDGFIKKGTIVHKNYVLVVKTAKIPKPTNEYLYIDKSIIYKNDEPAIVEEVILPRSEDGVLSAKIKLRMNRPIRKGDKCCLTKGHKVLTTRGWVDISEINYSDIIATLNKTTNSIEYHKPNEIYQFECKKEELIKIDSNYVSMIATKNHKMYVRNNIYGIDRCLYTVDEITESFKVNIEKERANALIDKNKQLTEVIKIKDNQIIKTNKLTGHIPKKSVEFTNSSNGLIYDEVSFINDVNNDKKKYEGLYTDEYKNDIGVNEIFNKRIYERMIHNLPMKEILLVLKSFITNQSVMEVGKCKEILMLEITQMYKLATKLNNNEATLIINEISTLFHQLNKIKTDDNMNGRLIISSSLKPMINLIAVIVLHSKLDNQEVFIKQENNKYSLYIIKTKLTTSPENYQELTIDDTEELEVDSIEHKDYKVINVYCFNITNNIFMVKYNNKIAWTGNSSRTGNKGIIGKELDQADMPYDENGMCPDIIVNPHSIPSRMAIGQLFEAYVGTLGLEIGKIFDATCFKKVDIYELIDRMEKIGIKYGGKRRLYNGQTGNWIDTHILLCPNTYQRLLKFIDDECYYVNRGPTNALTHQPVDGRVHKGGIRIGEMEEWVLGAHGSMRALSRKLYKDADEHIIPVCRRCGNKAITNSQKGFYICKYCGDLADIANVPSSWMTNVFTHMLSSMNIKTDFEVEPTSFSSLEN